MPARFSITPTAKPPATYVPIAAGGNDCTGTDQRGVPRPQGAACDSGAVEAANPALAADPAAADFGAVGEGGTSTRSVTVHATLDLTLTHRTFAVAKRKPPPKGTTIRFDLSEAASVNFSIRQKRPGRRKGKRCVAPTRNLRHAKQCTRIVTLGSFTRSENGAL